MPRRKKAAQPLPYPKVRPRRKARQDVAASWAIDATAEPSEWNPKGGEDLGTSVIRFGPERLSLIEDDRNGW